MERTKILIVDDEQDVVQALQFRLETAGYETLTAFDGAQALTVLRDRKVDLVLTDFMMPEVNGLELTRLVRENPAWARIKVVLFSCNADPEFHKRALELGAVDYLPKMTGAGSIVVRVYDCRPPSKKKPGDPHAAIPDETPEQRSLAQQMRTISEGIVDFIHLVRMGDELSPAAEYALQSAESLAQDLHRLASSVDATMLPMMKAGSRICSLSCPSRRLVSTRNGFLQPKSSCGLPISYGLPALESSCNPRASLPSKTLPNSRETSSARSSALYGEATLSRPPGAANPPRCPRRTTSAAAGGEVPNDSQIPLGLAQGFAGEDQAIPSNMPGRGAARHPIA